MTKGGKKKALDALDERAENQGAAVYSPVPTLMEDQASIDGLIDLLIVKGVIQAEGDITPEDVVKSYIDRYGSAMNGLCMLLYEKGIVSQEEHKLAIDVYHDAIRHYGSRAVVFEEVQSFRKNVLRKRLGIEAK